MRDNPKPFEMYRHFKGNQYQVLNIAKDSEDGHLVVVYQAMYGDYQVYVRALDSFMSPVDKVKYPDVDVPYRFMKVGGENTSEVTQATDTSGGTVSSMKGANDTNYSDEKDASDTTELSDIKKSDDQAVSDASVEEEYVLDPEVEKYLDTDSLEEKLNILAGLKRRITDEMLQIMSITMDIELNPGTVEEKYNELKNYLLMKEKFESQRRG